MVTFSMRIVGMLMAGVLVANAVAFAEGRDPSAAVPPQQAEGSRVYVDLSFATWHPRGRSMSQIAPAIRVKLAAAGFTVVPSQTDPHDFTLQVAYREERGRQFRFDTYGTKITCMFLLQPASGETLLDLTIREESGDYDFGTAPYLEALEKFDTNPYFYFLGDIVKGRVSAKTDTTDALIQGLSRMVQAEPRRGGPLPTGGDLSLTQSETVYSLLARENTIKELGRLKDTRAVPIFTSLLNHASSQVRLTTIEALREMQWSDEARSGLERLATHDPDRDVQQAATQVLASAGAPPSQP